MHFVMLAARTGPTVSQLIWSTVAARLDQRVLACTVINLQRAAEARQNAVACLPPRPQRSLPQHPVVMAQK